MTNTANTITRADSTAGTPASPPPSTWTLSRCLTPAQTSHLSPHSPRPGTRVLLSSYPTLIWTRAFPGRYDNNTICPDLQISNILFRLEPMDQDQESSGSESESDDCSASESESGSSSSSCSSVESGSSSEGEAPHSQVILMCEIKKTVSNISPLNKP